MDNGSQINTFAMNHMYHLIMVKKIKPLKTVERDFEMNQLQVERKTDQAIYGCSNYRSSGVITLAGIWLRMICEQYFAMANHLKQEP
jgi:hypothetical protein